MTMKDLCFDFVSMNHAEIQALLAQHHLTLTVEEALTIQHRFYKSTRHYLKQFNTNSSDVILGAKEDAGIVAVACDHAGHRYGLIVSNESHNHPSQIVPYEGAATEI